MLGLVAVRSYLDVDEFSLLMKYHPEHQEALFEVLFQTSAAGFLLQLSARLAKEHALGLYENYITGQCQLDRHCLLLVFLKKMLSTLSSPGVVPDLTHCVSVPLLV